MTNTGSSWLYARWLETEQRFSAEPALHDIASGRRWSFRELHLAGLKTSTEGALAFPRGQTPDFIFKILAAWREGRPVCPLECNQNVPNLKVFPGDIAHLKITSGTTGTPRVVLFTARQLAADARNIVSTMGLRHEWPNLGVISLAHSYGFSNLVTPLLLHGIPLVLAPSPLPETVLRAAALVPQITLPAVPALWRAWLGGKSIPANTRLAISAGAPLPRELEHAIYQEHGLKVHNFYGSSECGGIAYDRTAIPRNDGSVIGTAMDNVHLSIADRGTLIVRGEAVGETYFPESDESLRHPLFHTSDLAEIEEGQLRLTGRLSDVINVAGRKVTPDFIESVLRQHPAVDECVVFGVTGLEHTREDTIVACISARGALDGRQLAQFLSSRLPGWQIPRRWWFSNELSADARGKISRAQWRARYLSLKVGEIN